MTSLPLKPGEPYLLHAVQERCDTLRGRGNTLRERYNTLRERGNTLRGRGNALRERCDTLRGRGNALRERGNALRERGNPQTPAPPFPSSACFGAYDTLVRAQSAEGQSAELGANPTTTRKPLSAYLKAGRSQPRRATRAS